MAFRAPSAPRYWNRCGLLDCFGRYPFCLGWLLPVAALGGKMDFILPHGGLEITLWIALSVTAGICEETIFRGYLQRQVIALTKNVPAGILLSAAHSVPLTRTRASGGDSDRPVGRHVWVHWRGSVRPGIIAHAWQDSLNGVLVGLSRP